MILLLGATTYVGQAFARALRWRKESFIPLSRRAFDYARFEFLFDYVHRIHPDFIINAAEHPESRGHDSGEAERMEMLQTNTVLPQTIARVCGLTRTPWGQVSSGNVFCGAKLVENGGFRVTTDLSLPAVRWLFELHPDRLAGFTELDPPNASFDGPAASFYSGTKALAEESIQHQGQCYIWRFRLPFNEVEEAENFLSRLQSSPPGHDALNSLSHVDDCVGACLELWERRAAFGIYNVVNPGVVALREVLALVARGLRRRNHYAGVVPPADTADKPPQLLCTDCILDGSKLRQAGVRLRPVREALEKSLAKWQPQSPGVLHRTWSHHDGPNGGTPRSREVQAKARRAGG